MILNNTIANVNPAQHPDYEANIIHIIRSGLTPAVMRKELLAHHENHIAAALDLLNSEERMRLYNILEPRDLAAILEYCDQAARYASEISIGKQVLLFSHLESSTAANILQQMEKTERNTLMELLNPEMRQQIFLINSFDEDLIGNHMSTNYICINADLDVCRAMDELLRQAAQNDNISTIYVVDENNMLAGAIDLKDLIIARRDTPLSAITMTAFPYVYTWEAVEDCIDRLQDYSEASIPVLDSRNRLCGVLTSQIIAQLADDEMGEDYAKLAGLSAEEDLHEPIQKSIGKRLPWLIILLGLGLLVSGVVGMFEAVVAHLTIIVSFQSLILDMAGNAGTQSLAVTIRVLMDERLTRKQKLRLLGKEARIGLINGTLLGILSLLCIGTYLLLLKGHPISTAICVSLCAGAAMIVSVLLSSICGTAVPILFKKLGIDPAVASGPLITTLNDLVAILSYYGLAWLLLIHVLHL